MKYLLALFAILSLVGCTQVDTGNVGVESTLGQVKTDEVGPGLYFTLFKNVDEFSTKEIGVALNDLRPKTKDNLTMADMDIDVYYKTDSTKVADILIRYSGDIAETASGDYFAGYNFVHRNAREAAYNSANKFNASEMNIKRQEIAEEIRINLQKELDKTVGDKWFTITNVNVRALTTDPQIETAIREAAQTQFEVSRKQQELALAAAEAERLKVEAEGQAAANRIISESLSGQLLRLKEIEMQAQFAKAGTHTVVMGESTPLINIKER